MGLRLQMAFLLAAVVILVSGTLVGLALVAGTEQVEETTEANQDQAAAAVLEALGVHIDALDKTLTGTADTLARTGVPESADDEGAIIMDSLVAVRHQFDAVHIIEGDTVRMSRPVGAEVPAAAFRAPDAHTPRADEETGELLMVVPIGKADPCCRLVGVVNKQVMEDWLMGGIQGLTAGTQGMVRLMVSDTGEPVELANTPRWSLRLAEMGGALPASGSHDGYRVSSVQTAWPADLEAVLLVPETETSALFAGLVRSTVPGSLFLVGAGLLVGVVVANRIMDPLQGLKRASGRMRDGDLGVRARPSGAPEFVALAEDFNRMAEALQEDRSRLVGFQHTLEDEVERRTAALQAKTEEMERFFYGVSHDMKSPVVAISNYADLARRRLETDPEQVTQALDTVTASSHRLRDLIEEVLLFSEVQEVEPALVPVDVPEVVGRVVDQVTVHERGHEVAVTTEGGPLQVRTDPGRLQHMLENLVENAVRYGHRDGRASVHIAWRPLVAGWSIEVVDRGPGIPRQRLDRLFQPFGQHARRGGHTGGAGLGLSIVKRMADSLGAHLDLSTSSTGTRFAIRFTMQSGHEESEENR